MATEGNAVSGAPSALGTGSLWGGRGQGHVRVRTAAWPAPDSVLLTHLQGSSVFHSVEDMIF